MKKAGRVIAFALIAAMLISENSLTMFAEVNSAAAEAEAEEIITVEEEENVEEIDAVSSEEDAVIEEAALSGEDEERSEKNIVSGNAILTDDGIEYTLSPVTGAEGEYLAEISFDTKKGGKFSNEMTTLNVLSSLTVDDKTYNITAIKKIDEMPEDGKISKIVFDEGIESIYASLSPELTAGVNTVVFPSTIKEVQGNSFTVENGCLATATAPWLKNAKAEDGVVYAGRAAIYFPEGKESVTLKAGTLSVSPFAAFGNTKLKSVNVADSVESVFPFAFSGCSSLVEFSIPENSKMKKLGYDVFGYFTNHDNAPKLESIFIPGAVLTSVMDCTDMFFKADTLKNVTFGGYAGKDDTYIAYMMFGNCTGLKSITIPSYLTYIETFAFWGCTSLSKFTIPEDSKLKQIKYGAFGWVQYDIGDYSQGTANFANSTTYLPNELTEEEKAKLYSEEKNIVVDIITLNPIILFRPSVRLLRKYTSPERLCVL